MWNTRLNPALLSQMFEDGHIEIFSAHTSELGEEKPNVFWEPCHCWGIQKSSPHARNALKYVFLDYILKKYSNSKLDMGCHVEFLVKVRSSHFQLRSFSTDWFLLVSKGLPFTY